MECMSTEQMFSEIQKGAVISYDTVFISHVRLYDVLKHVRWMQCLHVSTTSSASGHVDLSLESTDTLRYTRSESDGNPHITNMEYGILVLSDHFF